MIILRISAVPAPISKASDRGNAGKRRIRAVAVTAMDLDGICRHLRSHLAAEEESGSRLAVEVVPFPPTLFASESQ